MLPIFYLDILSFIIIFYNSIYYFKHDELDLKFHFIFVFDIIIQKYYLFIKVFIKTNYILLLLKKKKN